MRSGFNPTRRNRNIGTPKQGHGQNNRLVIPGSARHFSYLDKIGEHRREQHRVAGKAVTFIVEKTREGSVHPCSVEDVARLLGHVPDSDWAGLDTILFRMPTRKQAVIDPAWGRLRYHGEVSMADGRIVASGPMILLEGIDTKQRIEWSSSLALEDQTELDRLRADGHGVERVGSRYLIRPTPESARNTQLFRTLPHEIGHWFDWLGKVAEPAARGDDFGVLVDRYFARPTSEREAFAHRYADRLREHFTNVGVVSCGQRPNEG